MKASKCFSAKMEHNSSFICPWILVVDPEIGLRDHGTAAPVKIGQGRDGPQVSQKDFIILGHTDFLDP